jgi:hypothetical protein
MPIAQEAGVRHRLFIPLLRLEDIADRHEKSHRVLRMCYLPLLHNYLQRMPIWTAEDSLGSTTAAIDLISWGQPHGHLAFINIVHGVWHLVFVCGRTRKLLPGMSRGCGS